MKQYHDLLKAIQEQGTNKKPARSNMPGTRSLFGYQMRFDLQEGFPMLTTKKLSWRIIVTECLWFLTGRTNIKYLVDRNVNIWSEDSFNIYKKLCAQQNITNVLSFEDFINFIKNCQDENDLRVNSIKNSEQDINGNLPCIPKDYVLGSCQAQYGWLWRTLETSDYYGERIVVDQIKDLIEGLKTNPEGRRHIISAWNVGSLKNMALNSCHSFVQFNTRQLTAFERENYYAKLNNYTEEQRYEMNPNASDEDVHLSMDELNIPKYFIDCMLTQRSGDVFLGIPFNSASYALITHFLAKICNMIPGEVIHSMGDVHIYDNHVQAVEEQLSRDYTKYPLPTLTINPCPEVDWTTADIDDILKSIEGFELQTFKLENYQAFPSIKAELSTGLIK